jgi:NTE family protein
LNLLLLICAGIFFSGCKSLPSETEKPVIAQPTVTPAPAPIEIKPEVKPEPVVARKKNPPKIGLALGGGAVRGFAHVGVIKTLEAQGINIDIITGTSAGSIVGALYAGGSNGFDLQKIALAMDESVATDWTILPNRGVFKGESLQNYINQALSNRNIEKLNKVFGVVATDLQSGEMAVFRQGNTGMAVRASSSVPGVFQPMAISGREYVDGGLTSPVPVRAAKLLGADIVIAVDISKPPESGKTGNGLDLLLQTFAIMGKSINYFELNEAQVVIRPNIGDMSPADFKAKHLAILEGERAAQGALEKIRLTIERYYATP